MLLTGLDFTGTCGANVGGVVNDRGSDKCVCAGAPRVTFFHDGAPQKAECKINTLHDICRVCLLG